MNALIVSKSRGLNMIEGMALTALMQGIPIYASAAMILRLSNADLARSTVSTTVFIVLAVLGHALLTSLAGPRFSKTFKGAYEPLFFDSALSLTEKIARWRMQPRVSVQLLASMLMSSMLAIAVVCTS